MSTELTQSCLRGSNVLLSQNDVVYLTASVHVHPPCASYINTIVSWTSTHLIIESEMAGVLSLNPNCHKPFSVISQNPNLNSSPKSIAIQKLSSSFFRVSIQTNHRRRRRTPIFNAIDQESDQSTEQDSEEESVGVKAALSMLKFYKREISPLMPNSCRYVPTCSEYSMEAYKKYGVAKGTILTAWRLCRCNPLGGSGFDPPRWFDEQAPPEQ